MRRKYCSLAPAECDAMLLSITAIRPAVRLVCQGMCAFLFSAGGGKVRGKDSPFPPGVVKKLFSSSFQKVRLKSSKVPVLIL